MVGRLVYSAVSSLTTIDASEQSSGVQNPKLRQIDLNEIGSSVFLCDGPGSSRGKEQMASEKWQTAEPILEPLSIFFSTTQAPTRVQAPTRAHACDRNYKGKHVHYCDKRRVSCALGHIVISHCTSLSPPSRDLVTTFIIFWSKVIHLIFVFAGLCRT